MKLTYEHILFAALCAYMCWWATPTNASKVAGGLYLNQPVECPDGVYFSWQGGVEGTEYSLWRRMVGDTWWMRIQMGLGPTGSYFAPGFTLDKTWEYRISAEAPE